jgi:hypothetical protein
MPDTDGDSDADNAHPAALSGSQPKATGFPEGYLLFLSAGFAPMGGNASASLLAFIFLPRISR